MRRGKITWSISGKSIGLEAKYSRNVVEIKKEIAALLLNGSVVFLLHCKRSKIILAELFSEMCCQEDNAS